MAKKALVRVMAVDVECPVCHECVAHPETGSLMWEVFTSALTRGHKITCDNCATELEIPSWRRVVNVGGS